MSTRLVDYFLGRLNGRFGSSTAGALGGGVATGASPNVRGTLPKSVASAAGVCATGAGGGVQVCCGCGTSGEGVIHCGCAGTLTSGAVPYPVIFPRRQPQSPPLFLYHVSKLRYLR